MEAQIEKYLRDLAIKHNPYFQEDPDEDDSQGIIVFQKKMRLADTETNDWDKWKIFDYVLLIGTYDKKPNMESIVDELLFQEEIEIDGRTIEIEVIEGEGEIEGKNQYRAILVSFKYIYKIVEVS